MVALAAIVALFATVTVSVALGMPPPQPDQFPGVCQSLLTAPVHVQAAACAVCGVLAQARRTRVRPITPR